MKTYGFDFGLREGGKIYEFKSRKYAQECGNGLFIASAPEDLIGSSVTTQQMLTLYNVFFADSPRKEYKSKEVAAKSMIALAQARAVKVVPTTDRFEPMTEVKKDVAKTTKKEPIKKAKAEGNGRRGRNSMFDGRRFKVKDGLTENPRRAGTKGHSSFMLLLDSPDGLKYEDYLAAGGRRVDLAWDLIHGNVEVA